MDLERHIHTPRCYLLNHRFVWHPRHALNPARHGRPWPPRRLYNFLGAPFGGFHHGRLPPRLITLPKVRIRVLYFRDLASFYGIFFTGYFAFTWST